MKTLIFIPIVLAFTVYFFVDNFRKISQVQQPKIQIEPYGLEGPQGVEKDEYPKGCNGPHERDSKEIRKISGR